MITLERASWQDKRRNAEFHGLSTDVKPLVYANNNKPVDNGSIFYEIDTGKTFVFDKETNEWLLKSAGGSGVEVVALDVNENGTYTAPQGQAYSPVVVDVQPDLEEKTVTITENGTTTILPTEGKDGISELELTVDIPSKPEQTKSTNITQNGTTHVTPDSGKVLSDVEIIVNVPNPSTGAINISENGTYDVTQYASAIVNIVIPEIPVAAGEVF